MDTHSPGASAPAVFRFHSSEVRTIDRDCQAWFVASDIAKALNYRNADDMTRVLDEDEKGTHIMRTLGGEQSLTIISESGLYHALLKSRKPEAKRFRKWITAEVLPAIRRTGRYAGPGDRASLPPPVANPAAGLPGTKLLLTFEADGRYRAEPAPEGAMVVTARQIAEIVEANGYILAKPVDKEFKL